MYLSASKMFMHISKHLWMHLFINPKLVYFFLRIWKIWMSQFPIPISTKITGLNSVLGYSAIKGASTSQ